MKLHWETGDTTSNGYCKKHVERARIWCGKKGSRQIRVWFSEDNDDDNYLIAREGLSIKEAQKLAEEILKEGPRRLVFHFHANGFGHTELEADCLECAQSAFNDSDAPILHKVLRTNGSEASNEEIMGDCGREKPFYRIVQ